MKRRKIVDIINNINHFDDFFKKYENLIDWMNFLKKIEN